MNFKLLSYFLIIAIGFFLTSCEGDTNRDWAVQNDSSTEITVNVDLGSQTESISIGEGSSTIIASTNQLGGTAVPESPSAVFSLLVITNDVGDTLKTDVFSEFNWDTEISKVKNAPSHYEHSYTLVVKDEDF